MDELGQVLDQRKVMEKGDALTGFVQTDRQAHEKWALLGIQYPAASALLHLLTAHVGDGNAVIASQNLMARLLSCSKSTVRRAVKVLEQGNWIEIVQIGPSGSVNAYVLNSRIAWSKPRDQIRFARITADVLLVSSEQPNGVSDNKEPLHQLPRSDEHQLPTGDGLAPPSQPDLPSLEADLPSVAPDHAPLPHEADTVTSEDKARISEA